MDQIMHLKLTRKFFVLNNYNVIPFFNYIKTLNLMNNVLFLQL